MTVEEVQSLGAQEIKEGQYSPVVLASMGYYAIKSKSGKEYVFDGDYMFYHSDGKEFFVKHCPQDIEDFKILIEK